MTQVPPTMPIPQPTPAPAPVPSPVAKTEHRHTGFLGGVKKVLGFFAWILTGFGLINVLRRRKNDHSNEELVFHTVHPSFYLWAIILAGFVSSACVNHWPGSALAWGWVYVFVLLYTIVALLFDVSTPKALLWGGIFCLLWIISKYLEDLKHMTVL